MSTEQFSLCWDNFHKNMSSGMHSLLETEDLVDVTLAVEGRYLKAHKMVLSVCSPYFRELFKTNPCQHPIVFMKDVSYSALSDLLQFMYQGEVQVLQENLATFIKTAEALQIKGLTNDSTNTDDVPDSDKPPGEKSQKRPFDSDEFKVTTTRVKRTIGPAPASKKPRSEMSKSEIISTPATEVVEFKMEPYETTDNGSVSRLAHEDSTNFNDDTNDDGTDDHEDYSLIEGNVDDPQAGTSSETTGDNQGMYKFVITTTGNKRLALHQHLYQFAEDTDDGRQLWNCISTVKKCPAKCYVRAGKLQCRVGTHNHAAFTRFIREQEQKGRVVYKRGAYFVHGRRGSQHLVFHNHIYLCDKRMGEKAFWGCAKYRAYKCKARATTTGYRVNKITHFHNHMPDLEALKILGRSTEYYIV